MQQDFDVAYPGMSGPTSGRGIQSRFGRGGHGGRCGRGGRGRGGRGRGRGGERPVPYTGSSHYPVRHTRTLNFVCMSGMNEESTPSRERLGLLGDHGLGQKKVVLHDKNGDHKHIREELELVYPA